MINEPISEDIIQQAILKEACPQGIQAAIESTWQTLSLVYQEWAAQHLDLPDEIAEYLYKQVGIRSYWKGGLRHREDGPALIITCRREWWLNGQRHREDGLAVEDSRDYKEWWLNGLRYYGRGRAYSETLGALQASRGQLLKSQENNIA